MANQKLIFCGVGAHHQNGIGEVNIRRSVEDTRVSLLHAKREWPRIIATNLWPFFLKLAIDNHNHLSFNKDALSPVPIVAGFEEEIDMPDYDHFYCPAFVLDEKKQSGLGETPKWDPKSRAGVYLG